MNLRKISICSYLLLASGDEAGFTEDWVQNHAARASQRQLEVHDVPQGAPRTQLQPQDDEESK